MLHLNHIHIANKWRHVHQSALVKAVFIAFILILFAVLILDLFTTDMPEQVFAILRVFTGLLIFAQIITFCMGKWNCRTQHMAINPRIIAMTIILAIAGIMAVEELVINPTAGIVPFLETIIIASLLLIVVLILQRYQLKHVNIYVIYALSTMIVVVRIVLFIFSSPTWPFDVATWINCCKYFLNTMAIVLSIFIIIRSKTHSV